MATARQFHDGAFTPPQFPLDPFDAPHAREPWSLDASTLPSDDLLTPQRKVILVLGEPPLDAIAPLLQSPHLLASLLIIATSRNYVIPSHSAPAIRILRLGVPLASSNFAASRLVAIFQWAERVASAWRTDPSSPQYQELAEDGPAAGYLTPPQRMSWFGNSSAPPSPATSDLALALSQSPPRSLSGSSTKRSSITGTAPKTSLTERDITRRAFDALFDFLPPDAPDRQLLKYAILVTTVVRPFLTCNAPPPPPAPKPRRRFSLRGRPSAPPSPPPATPTHTPAHLVHLVPPARSTLIHPLESFCLSFSYPNASSRSAPALGLPINIDIGDPGPLPRPYVMPPTALGDALHVDRQWTLAELILCGALDGDSEYIHPRSRSVSLRSLAKFNRAWIGGVGDLVLESGRTRERVMGEQQPQGQRAPMMSQTTPEGRLSPTGSSKSSRGPLLLVQPNSRISSKAQPPSLSEQSHRARSQSQSQSLRSRPSQRASSSTANALTSHPSTSSSSHSSSHKSYRAVQPADPALWPTPPSSTSSSPELSAAKGKGKGKELPQEDMQEHGVKPPVRSKSSTGMLTPPWDRRDGGGSSTTSKRRRGLFAWLKR